MPKRYMLAAAVTAALLTLLMGGYGCMGKFDFKYNVNEDVLAYLEQRYGEKFTYVKSTGPGMSLTGRAILVSCESFPGEEIYVSITREGEEEVYRDNYMDYYFAGQVSEMIAGIAKDYFDDVSFKVTISDIQSSSAMDLTTTFEEYFTRENYFVRGNMDVGAASEETMREFAAELLRRGIQFSIGIDVPSVNEGYSIRYYNEEDEEIYFRRRK